MSDPLPGAFKLQTLSQFGRGAVKILSILTRPKGESFECLPTLRISGSALLGRSASACYVVRHSLYGLSNKFEL
jgi:hypothetical protein